MFFQTSIDSGTPLALQPDATKLSRAKISVYDPKRLCVEEKNMRQRKIVRTTLGDLIVAVTDEVTPIIRDRASAYVVVSWLINDILTHQHLRADKLSRTKLIAAHTPLSLPVAKPA